MDHRLDARLPAARRRDPSVNPRRNRSPWNRALRRTILLVLTLVVILYAVVPRIGAGREGVDRLLKVNPLLVLLAVGLEACALVAYALMTRATLPKTPHIRLFTLVRIQLSTKAMGNVTPAGMLTGNTLGYRLLTAADFPGPAVGFTLATVGLGSAVVLNLLLWICLLISIPFNGFNPAYVSAAIVGALLMAAAFSLGFLLMRGVDKADRVVRSIARHVPFVEEETASRFARQTALRLHDLARQPELIRNSVFWAVANWLLDASVLWVFVYALGTTMNPLNLFVAYGLANILAAIPITPGGLGVVEAALPPTLVGLGAPASIATIAVLSWRSLQYLLPIPTGGIAYLSLRLGGLGRAQRELEQRQAAVDRGLDRHVWDEQSGQFLAVTREELARAEADEPGSTTPA
jgi:uncharacterized protein (TIRG00374 family)